MNKNTAEKISNYYQGDSQDLIEEEVIVDQVSRMAIKKLDMPSVGTLTEDAERLFNGLIKTLGYDGRIDGERDFRLDEGTRSGEPGRGAGVAQDDAGERRHTRLPEGVQPETHNHGKGFDFSGGQAEVDRSGEVDIHRRIYGTDASRGQVDTRGDRGSQGESSGTTANRSPGQTADGIPFRVGGVSGSEDLGDVIARMRSDAEAAIGAESQSKREAMRAIGGNLGKLRQAMSRQRKYDDHQRLNNTAGETTSTEIPRVKSAADGIVDVKLQQFFERASAELLPHDMRARAMELSEKLHTPIKLVDSADEAMDNPSARHRHAKGWVTDKGEIVVIVPNHSNVSDIENTVVHEIVGHDELEAMIGPERMDEFVMEVYDHAGQGIKKKIDARADKEYSDDIDRMTRQKGGGVFAKAEATARANAKKRDGHYQREATKEYMADMAGEIGDKGFERMSQEEQTLWGKIKAKVQQFLDKFLRGLNIAKSIQLKDKDLAYILYKAWKHKRENGVFAEAEDIAMRRKTGYDRTMFADGENKKNTAKSEAGLNPIYPSSNGGQNVTGREARLNDLDPASNHDAKVIEKLEIATKS